MLLTDELDERQVRHRPSAAVRLATRLFLLPNAFKKWRGASLLLADELDERLVRHRPSAPVRLVLRLFSLPNAFFDI